MEAKCGLKGLRDAMKMLARVQDHPGPSKQTGCWGQRREEGLLMSDSVSRASCGSESIFLWRQVPGRTQHLRGHDEGFKMILSPGNGQSPATGVFLNCRLRIQSFHVFKDCGHLSLPLVGKFQCFFFFFLINKCMSKLIKNGRKNKISIIPTMQAHYFSCTLYFLYYFIIYIYLIGLYTNSCCFAYILNLQKFHYICYNKII